MFSETVYWVGLFVVGFVAATILYNIAVRIQLMALVDLLWTTGLGLAGVVYLISQSLVSFQGYAVLTLLSIWSFRLSYHIFTDRVIRGKEDPRYANLTEYWGDKAQKNFLFIFLGQVPLVALFVLPVSVAMAVSVEGVRLVDFLAIGIALVALIGEGVADRQLAKFRADPSNKGGVCKSGLWRYSRHPNYFFEWLHWWAYVSFAWGAENWWLSLLGPFAMFIFLRFVTGVPPAEKSSLKSRGEAYRKYQSTTNAFFPWKPHDHLL
jgi:steroid 5-alpha reductase family enzyme